MASAESPRSSTTRFAPRASVILWWTNRPLSTVVAATLSRPLRTSSLSLAPVGAGDQRSTRSPPTTAGDHGDGAAEEGLV